MVIAVHIRRTSFARSDSMSQEYEKHQAKDDAYHRVQGGRHGPLTP